MVRNVVQFQKGLSEPVFEQQYSTEEQCRAIAIASRWPHGFECPICGGRQYCVVTTAISTNVPSAAGRRRRSPGRSASTHLPLRLWFRAIYHLTQTKQGISSIGLGRRLGVTQTTAWKIKHKLKQVMLERDATKRLTGRVEIDDAYLGGGRQAESEAEGAWQDAVRRGIETTTEGKPVRLKLRRVTSFCASSIVGLAERSSIQTALSSAMAFSVSPASPTPGARTKSSRPGQDQKRLGRQPSNGSTPRSATSRPPSQGPTVPSTASMFRATSPIGIPLQPTIRSGHHDPAPH